MSMIAFRSDEGVPLADPNKMQIDMQTTADIKPATIIDLSLPDIERIEIVGADIMIFSRL